MSDQLLWFATRGAGIVSLILLTGVVYLGILTTLRFQTPAWPRFATTGLHRRLALISVVFLGLHIVTAAIDPFAKLGWLAALVPFSSSYRTFWLGLGVVAVDLGMAVLVTSLLRRRMSRRAWRVVHWLSYAAWPLALLHGIGTGTDAAAPWMAAIDLACLVAVGSAVVVRIAAGRSPARASIIATMQPTRGASASRTANPVAGSSARPIART